MKVISYWVRADGITHEAPICDECAKLAAHTNGVACITEAAPCEYEDDIQCSICGVTDYEPDFLPATQASAD